MDFIKQIFNRNSETPKKEIGQFQCSKSELVNKVTDLLNRFNLLNPSKLTTSSSTGVRIRKNEDGTFLISLLMFTPPVEIRWTQSINPNAVDSFLEKLIEENKKICFMNSLNTTNGSLVQFAIA